MKKRYRFRYVMSFLLAMLMLTGCFGCAQAAADPLKPDDLTYDNGNIILHKQAERISEDEWEVTVRATIDDSPVEKPQIEVVFVLDVSSTMNACAVMEQHNSYINGGGFTHTHTDDCPAGCTATMHVHVSGSPSSSGGCYMMGGANGVVYYERRINVARSAINDLVDGLPADATVKYAYFSTNAGTTTSYDALGQYDIQGQTYIMKGVDLGIDQFTNTGKTQIMILVTDGQATDNLYTSTKFENFRNNGGVVFTVGFNHDDPNLRGMTANGGSYFTATNPGDLTEAFDVIQGEITAMLKDPMGSNVGFDVTSITSPANSVSGKVTHTEDTIYWTPSTGTQFSDATIEYSYKVALNDNASMDVGRMQVPLNKPTSLLYGIKNGEVVDMKDAAFPIPEATYSIASVQVNWKYGNTDIQTPTETESIINDFGTPAFETDYTTITQLIPASGNNKYRYTGTTITRNGTVVDAVDPADPAAFVVTHNYELTEAYNVTYEYTGTVPDGAPEASLNNTTGKPGETVAVAADPTLSGWVFSGWSVAEGGATVTDGSFTMPRNDVKLVGSWQQVTNSYQVLANYYTSTDGGPLLLDNAQPVELVPVTVTSESSVTYDYTGAATYMGNLYDWISLTEDSPATREDGLINITPADPTAVVTIKFFREVVNPYQATVHYVDEAGNALADDTVQADVYVGSDYDVSAAEAVGSITVDGVIYDFVSDDTAANGTAYKGRMPAGGVEITRVYAEREKATATVHYVDEDGNALADDTVQADVYVGSNYDVSAAEDVTSITVDGVIYDFVNDDTAANGTAYSGEMPEGGVEITRVYAEREKATATVHYVDEDGNTLQPDLASEAIYIGSNYDVSVAEAVDSITVDGVIYDFVSDDTATNGTAYSGKMPEGGVEITRVYAEREKATATVHYVDEGGNELQADTVQADVYVGSEYDVSAAEDVTSITVDGAIYDFVSDDTAASGTAYTGQMPAGGVEITRTYAERGKATATVHYVDESGNTLQPDLVSEAIYIGSNYDVSEAESVTTITVGSTIYDYMSDDTAANGTAYTGEMPEAGVEITRTYAERGKAIATVHYVDESGNTLADDTVQADMYIGSNYDVSSAESVTTITVDGVIYDFVSDDTAANGTAYTGEMPEGGVEITRTYAERGKATATVHYVDTEGNTLQPDLVSETIYIGNNYDVSAAEDVTSITVGSTIYDFVSDDTATNGTAYTSEMPEGGVEITRTYAERGKATATVHYVDEDGNVLQADLVSDPIYIGNNYDVSEAEDVATITVGSTIYDYVSDDTAANGIAYTGEMPEGGVEITRTYAERGKATATVHYVDESGNTLADDTVQADMYIGSNYDVSSAESVTTITVGSTIYDFVSDDTAANDTAYTGEMPEAGVEITRTYAERGKAIATVHYVDTEGNTMQPDLVSEAIYIGSDYDVSEAEDVTTITVGSTIYEFVSDDTAANGTAYSGKMPEGGVEITRVYAERGKATATVHYVDTEGNTLQPDLVSDPIYIGSNYDVSAAEDVTSITVDGTIYDFVSDDTAANTTAYTGEMPEGGVEITRTYAERGKATATVHYVDESGNTLADDTVQADMYVGSNYDVSSAESVTSITVDGRIYDFVSDDTAANGTAYTGEMPVGGVEITRTYAERGKATATVHYVDESDNTLQPDLVSDPIYIGSNYDVSEAEDVTSITVDGVIYDFVSDDTAANGMAYTGEMPEGGVEITRTYAERGKATATVHYVDTEGNTLQPDLASEAIYIGSNYDVSEVEAVTTITVDGTIYDFVSDDTAANGTAYTGEMPEGGVEITRTYVERGKATAIVHYVDTEGNTLQPDLVSDPIYIGNNYDVSSAEAVTSITTEAGIIYDFSHDDTAANNTAYTGDMPAGGVEITRTYIERGKATATVHYVDESGNTFQPDTTTDPIYIGSNYDVSEAEDVTSITVDGTIYDFVSDDTAANSTAYTGEMPKGGVEITRTYVERGKATATVHYVDTEGNTLQPDLVSDPIYIGNNYDVSEAEDVATITVGSTIYDYVSDDTAANSSAYTDQMPAGGVEITRTYAERGKATATVHYVDESGNTLQPDLVSNSIYIGSNYDVSEAEAVTTITVGSTIYDFVSDDTAANSTAYTGDMPEGGVEITRTYIERGKATAIVHYVDESGNPLQPDTVTDPIYIGSNYDVSSAEAVTSITTEAGIIYDFSHDDTAANSTAYTGDMPEGGVEITRTYVEHGKATAIVHFVDENGNALQADLVTEGIYIGSNYDVTDALSVELIEKDGREYQFVTDYLTENAGEMATAADDTEATDEDYTGLMPEGGVEITRVYREMVFYYQLKHEYTAYDASGAVKYTATDTWAVMATYNRRHTIQSPDTYEHGGYTFQRVSEAEQTGDLTGTTQDAPYVFTVYYEVRESEPEATPTPNPGGGVPGVTMPPAPPQTGDEGPALWLMCLILSGMSLILLMTASRRRQRS